MPFEAGVPAWSGPYAISYVLARLRSASLLGIEEWLVELDVSFGLPTFNMARLPDSSVRESLDRVRSEIRNSDFEFPARHVTIHLASDNVRKRGTSYDLPIAVGVLAAGGFLRRRYYGDLLLLTELSLDGTIQSMRSVLLMALVARQHAHLGRHCQTGPDSRLLMIQAVLHFQLSTHREDPASPPPRLSKPTVGVI